MSRTERIGRDLRRSLPVEAVTPDGLIITAAGTVARLLEIEQPAQPLTSGPEGRRRHRQRMATLARRIGAHQSLQLTIVSDPLDVDRVIADGAADVRAAANAVRHEARDLDETSRAQRMDLATAMERLHAAEAHTLREHAEPAAAQAIRYLVTVPWRPQTPIRYRKRGAQPRRGRAAVELSWPDFLRADRDGARELAAVAGDLSDMNPRQLDGAACLAVLRERFHPGQQVDWYELDSAASGLEAVTPEDAAEQRDAIAHAVIGGAAQRARGSDVHHADGTIERTLRLTGTPEVTSAWWLLPIWDIERPWRLSIHVHGTDRGREKLMQRARRRRLRSTRRARQRRGHDVSPEHEDAERESMLLDHELHSGSRAGLFDVSIYLTILQPDGDTEALDEATDTIVRQFVEKADATLRPALGITRDVWDSTLPLGIDRAGCTRRYASRNIADVLSLVGTRSGTPGGVPLGFASPGRTVERLDPWDPSFRTPVGTITGLSGSGKTLAMTKLLRGQVARGAQLRIIDRSSMEDGAAADGGRAQGHYEPLLSLIPGSRVVRMASGGGEGGAVICPWDTDRLDDAAIATKVPFLVALHSLLIGQRAPGSSDRVLDQIDEGLLQHAIQRTYERARTEQVRPCEQLLIDTILDLAQLAEETGNVAAKHYKLLAERLAPFGASGAQHHLLNDQTTVDGEAPAIVFDIGGVSKQLAGPVSLIVSELLERSLAAQRARRMHERSPVRGGSWTGLTAIVLDEAWSQLQDEVAGAWLNEWARRIRHMSATITTVSQHVSDFKTAQGRAMLRQATWHVVFETDSSELVDVAADLGICAEEREIIAAIRKRTDGLYSSAYMVSPRGRGRIRVQLGNLEYWMLSAHPKRDQPLRAEAIRQAGGNPWAALRLLVDSRWQQAHRHLRIGEAA